MSDSMHIVPLYNGVVMVDCDTTSWGDPKTDESVYNLALVAEDLHSIEKRPGGTFEMNLTKGSIVFVRPGDVEQVNAGHKHGGRVALKAAVFKDGLVKQIFDDANLDGVKNFNDPVISHLLQAAIGLQSNSDPLLVDHVTMALLHRVRGMRRQPEIKSKGRIEKVLAYIDERLDQKLTLNELAEAAAMSSFHFARTFRQVTGNTPLSYVTARRVSRAKQLISKTKHPMAAIALMCGFSSQSHFSSAFKAATGHTPREFYLATVGGAQSIVESSSDMLPQMFSMFT
jgi:AraC-like DNA-binding protein